MRLREVGVFPTKAIPRILVAMDFGEGSRFALDCAALLRTHLGAVVDAYYVWPKMPGGGKDGAGGALRELETFSRREGAWDTFNYFGDLDRRGVIRIRGYLTPSRAGQPLVSFAEEGGYHLVLETAESLFDECFEVHGDFSADRRSDQTMSSGRCAVSISPPVTRSSACSRTRRSSRTFSGKP